MTKTFLKITKILGIGIVSVLLSVVLLWIVLSIITPLRVPDSNSVDYVKGVWMPDPRDVFQSYFEMNRMKGDGINTLSIGPFAINHVFSIVQKPFYAAYVKKAHRKGFVVHMAVNSWGPWTDTKMDHSEMKDYLTKEANYWAQFSEKYNIEYFSPQNEHDVLLGTKVGAEWAQEILPQIRDLYKGEVVLKVGQIFTDQDTDFDYDINIKSFTDEEMNMSVRFSDASGYDYLMIDIFPTDIEERNDLFLDDLGSILNIANEEVEKKDLKGVMIGEFAYPLYKPSYSEEIMPGAVVTEEDQAKYIADYLDVAMPNVNGVIYCGWSMKGYGFRGYPAEDVIKKMFNNNL